MPHTGSPQRISTSTRTRRALALILALLAGTAAGARAGTVELISKADPVPDAFGDSGVLSSLSADGRYIVFLSDALNLVPGQVDDNLSYDVFLHDQVAGTTTLVTHAAGSPARAGHPGDFVFSRDARISADGRYIAFTSPAADLIPGGTDTNRASDVFLYDQVTGTTTLVSHVAG
jgi:Tol biopolymer transport system component